MKVRIVLPWLLVLVSLAGMGWLYSANQKKDAELTALRADNDHLQQLRAEAEQANKSQVQDASDELVRLRKDHGELLRLRNEVQQLRGDKQALSGQVQAAQTQAERAQERFQAQAEAIRLARTPRGPVPATQASPQANPAAGAPPPADPEQANANTCINNLRLIEGAKQQWATAMQKPKGALLTATDLLPYLPNNTMPSCPAGGIYTLNPVGIAPLCNIPGHTLGH